MNRPRVENSHSTLCKPAARSTPEPRHRRLPPWLPSDCVIHRADVMRALLTAVTALDRAEARAQRRALLPDNVGKAWTGDEDTRLAEAFKVGQSPQEIAKRHRRTLRAVEARLQRMGLITESERTTRGGFPTPE